MWYCVGVKHLSDEFPIERGPKQGYALSPLLFSSVLEYSIRKDQENKRRLELKRDIWASELF
jgi:hypothetical protein